MTGCCVFGIGLLPQTMATLGVSATNTKWGLILGPLGGDIAPFNAAGPPSGARWRGSLETR